MVEFYGSLSRGTIGGPDHDRDLARLLVRLAVGLVQGAMLYGTYRLIEMNDFDAIWKVALMLVAAYAPPVWLAAVGQIGTRAAIIWSLIPTLLLIAIGLATGLLAEQDNTPLVIMVCLPAALFCAHHLVIPAIARGAPLAPYPDYYEAAWKAGIQLVLALMFLGAFWLILLVGAALFKAIGVDAVWIIISEEWFILFVCPLVFALGVELSDVREGLTQGIRTVALGLLSWLLPVIVFLAAAFLVTLAVAGLAGIHTSLSPAGFMLGLSAGMIILLNTVYQDGTAHLSGSAFLRMVMRIGCVLLVPMMALAIWAVGLRVAQHGLTMPRVVALTASIIGMIYAAGYALAQLPNRKGDGWLPVLEFTNIFAGIVTAVVLIAFSTPWFNPQQMAIDNQLARIASGKLSAEQIPYSWLGWQGGPRARAALEELATSADAEIARNAKAALENRYESVRQRGTVVMLPAGTAVPEGLDISEYCAFGECPARLFDVDGDGQEEVMIYFAGDLSVLNRDSEGIWKRSGTLAPRPECGATVTNLEVLRESGAKSLPPRSLPAFEIGGKVFDFIPQPQCATPEG